MVRKEVGGKELLRLSKALQDAIKGEENSLQKIAGSSVGWTAYSVVKKKSKSRIRKAKNDEYSTDQNTYMNMVKRIQFTCIQGSSESPQVLAQIIRNPLEKHIITHVKAKMAVVHQDYKSIKARSHQLHQRKDSIYLTSNLCKSDKFWGILLLISVNCCAASCVLSVSCSKKVLICLQIDVWSTLYPHSNMSILLNAHMYSHKEEQFSIVVAEDESQ